MISFLVLTELILDSVKTLLRLSISLKKFELLASYIKELVFLIIAVFFSL